MGPEGAVNIIFRKQIEAAEDPDGHAGGDDRGHPQLDRPLHRGGQALIDDIIDPRETRPVVIRALEMAADEARGAPVEEARRDAGLNR